MPLFFTLEVTLFHTSLSVVVTDATVAMTDDCLREPLT